MLTRFSFVQLNLVDDLSVQAIVLRPPLYHLLTLGPVLLQVKFKCVPTVLWSFTFVFGDLHPLFVELDRHVLVSLLFNALVVHEERTREFSIVGRGFRLKLPRVHLFFLDSHLTLGSQLLQSNSSGLPYPGSWLLERIHL